MDDVIPECISVTRAAASQKSGSDRRKEANRLPRAFFVYVKSAHAVVGAAVFLRACQVGDAICRAVWETTRGVMLARPFEITAAMARARGQVFALTAVAEANLRQQTAHVGGMLATLFPEFEGRPFRCFLVSVTDAFLLHGRHS